MNQWMYLLIYGKYVANIMTTTAMTQVDISIAD